METMFWNGPMLNTEGLYFYDNVIGNFMREISWLRGENSYLRKRIIHHKLQQKRCYNCYMPGHVARACCRPSRTESNWRTTDSSEAPAPIDTGASNIAINHETHDETVPDIPDTDIDEEELSTNHEIDTLRQWLKIGMDVTDSAMTDAKDFLIEQQGSSIDGYSCHLQPEPLTATWMPETPDPSPIKPETLETVPVGATSDTPEGDWTIETLRQWLKKHIDASERSDNFSITQNGTSRDIDGRHYDRRLQPN